MAHSTCSFDYSEWCARQATQIVETMRWHGPRGGLSRAHIWLIPCTDTSEGRLVVADICPTAAIQAVCMGLHRSLETVPYSHVASLIYQNCPHLPIIPANAWSDYKAA
jgi:hypothetical protein